MRNQNAERITQHPEWGCINLQVAEDTEAVGAGKDVAEDEDEETRNGISSTFTALPSQCYLLRSNDTDTLDIC